MQSSNAAGKLVGGAEGARHCLGPCAVSVMNSTSTFEIDGERFWTLKEFYDEISRVLIPGAHWGHNLDAFNDVLSGGFGTPNGGFILRWVNSDISRERLGHDETVKELERRLQRCDPTNRPSVARDLERAKRGEGPTVFDWLLDIIALHAASGHEDGVELILA